MANATANLTYTRTGNVNDWAVAAGPGETFRDFIAGFHALMQAGGLVNTLDTGQIDHTVTPAAPTVTGPNQRGFKMYRFDDALQATAPIFVKVFFYVAPTNITAGGTGVSYAYFTLFQFFTGTDGAGNGTMQIGTNLFFSANSSATLTNTTNYTGRTGPRTFRCIVLPGSLFVSCDETANNPYGGLYGLGMLQVERLRSEAGLLTGDGLVAMQWSTGEQITPSNGGTRFTTYVHNTSRNSYCYNAGTQGSVLHLFHTAPVMRSGVGLSGPNDVSLLPIYPYAPEPRGMMGSSMLTYSSINFTENDNVQVTVNGELCTFYCLGGKLFTPTSVSHPIAVRVA